jgi:hypothetical protein
MTPGRVVHRDVAAVMDECARWGVAVHIVKKVPKRFECPAYDDVGCSVRGGRVYLDGFKLDDPSAAPALLHEMAHVVVGTAAATVDEIDSGMLFIEHGAAKRLRLSRWEKWMDAYTIGGAGWDTWPDSTERDRQRALRRSKRGAKERGLVDGRGITYRKRAAL